MNMMLNTGKPGEKIKTREFVEKVSPLLFDEQGNKILLTQESSQKIAELFTAYGFEIDSFKGLVRLAILANLEKLTLDETKKNTLIELFENFKSESVIVSEWYLIEQVAKLKIEVARLHVEVEGWWVELKKESKSFVGIKPSSQKNLYRGYKR